MRTAVLFLVATLLAGVACGGGPPTTAPVLSSGRTIRILSMGQMSFTQASPALVLKYQTDLKIDDKEHLTEEVREIWNDFRGDADKAKVTSAIIMANEVPKGTFIQTGRSYNFVFERSAAGVWSQVPSR